MSKRKLEEAEIEAIAAVYRIVHTSDELEEIRQSRMARNMRPLVRCQACGKRRLCSETVSGHWWCDECMRPVRRGGGGEYSVVGPDGRGSGWVCRSTRALGG